MIVLPTYTPATPPPSGGISIVQANSLLTPGDAPFNHIDMPTWGTTPTSGNFLLAIVLHRANQSNTETQSSIMPSGYTLMGYQTEPGSATTQISIGYKIADGTETGGEILSANNTGFGGKITVYMEFSGVDTSTPYESLVHDDFPSLFTSSHNTDIDLTATSPDWSIWIWGGRMYQDSTAVTVDNTDWTIYNTWDSNDYDAAVGLIYNDAASRSNTLVDHTNQLRGLYFTFTLLAS